MNTIPACGENGALGDGLAGIMENLRGYPYGHLQSGAEDALKGAADRFVGRLAGHLRYSEGTLFPALRELEPGPACDIDELEKDHRLLHRYASALALEIRARDKEGAYGVARTFLAVLLDHIHRETEEVGQFVRSLDVLDAGRLSKALIRRRPRGDEGSGFQNAPGPF